MERTNLSRRRVSSRAASLLLAIILIIGMLPLPAGAATIPTSFAAPTSLAASAPVDFPFTTRITFAIDSALMRFIDDAQTDYDALGIDSVNHTAQVDYKVDSGNWQYTGDWDTLSEHYDANAGIYSTTGYLSTEATNSVDILDLRNGDSGLTGIQTKLGGAWIKGTTDSGDDNRLDTASHTFTFRVRVLVSYHVTDTDESKFILSPWSQTLTYGKGAATLAKPASLTAPAISNAAVGKNDDGSPCIRFTAATPKQVQDASSYVTANDEKSIEADHEININNTGWIPAEAGVWWLANENRSINVPLTYDNGRTVAVDSAYIQLRMRYKYAGGATVGALVSPWSNIISVNTPSWSKVSTWAETWLNKAVGYDLLPDILKGADMTQPINREEFAALAVKLYESLSGTKVTSTGNNPFTDTVNPEILKAVQVGITNGTSATKFSPRDFITREQCAVMLTRAYKSAFWEGWTLAGDAAYKTHTLDASGVTAFADDKHISAYAKPSVYFMVKNSIINGVDPTHFAPSTSGITTGAAANYGKATREVAIKIAVASVENLK